jgi:IS5 family transposase
MAARSASSQELRRYCRGASATPSSAAKPRSGMKAHIGVDVASGVVHTITGTAANEADINQKAALLHGREEAVFADSGYIGADKRPELEDCDVSWNIAIKRSIIKALPKPLRDWAEALERALSQVRARSSTRSTSSRTCSVIKSCAIAA